MVLEILKNQVNLPIVGGVSIAAVAVVGLTIFFLTRRKKKVELRL